ncbi:MAG: DUF6440 family protein [bacterium]|nr:DUF6440 family protein [bacterium]
MAKEKNKRFEIMLQESRGFGETQQILRDTVTGVCYLVATSGYGCGITPLLNVDGSPVVDRTVSTLNQ